MAPGSRRVGADAPGSCCRRLRSLVAAVLTKSFTWGEPISWLGSFTGVCQGLGDFTPVVTSTCNDVEASGVACGRAGLSRDGADRRPRVQRKIGEVWN